MFGEFISVLAGESSSGTDSSGEDDKDSEHAELEAGSSQTFDFWGAASGLADRVKRGTAELATTVRTTDWKAEIQAFGEDLVEETEELSASAVSAAHSAVEGIEHLPQTAQGALPAIEQRRKAVQAQLEQMGSRVGRLGRDIVSNTTDLFGQASSALQKEVAAVSAEGPEGRAARRGATPSPSTVRSVLPPRTARHSPLDADIAAMQRSSATYCEEPADAADYAAWLQGFEMSKREEDIAAVLHATPFMAELQSRIVPVIVDRETFWLRYFYQLHLLQTAHERQNEVTVASSQGQETGSRNGEVHSQIPTTASPAASADTSQLSGSSPALDSSPAKQSRPTDAPSGSPNKAPLEQPTSATQATAASHTGRSPVKGEARSATEEDGPVTTSDSSSGGNGQPWTVVTSPTKKAAESRSSSQRPAGPTGTTATAAADSGAQHLDPNAAVDAASSVASPVKAASNRGSPVAGNSPVKGDQQGTREVAADVPPAAPPVPGGNGGGGEGSDESDWGADVEAADDSDSTGGDGDWD